MYLREAVLLDLIDTWLGQVFSPPHLTTTLERMSEAMEEDPHQLAEREAAQRSVHECHRRLERYRAALEAGTDPTLIARWTAEVEAQRVMAQNPHTPGHRPRTDVP